MNGIPWGAVIIGNRKWENGTCRATHICGPVVVNEKDPWYTCAKELTNNAGGLSATIHALVAIHKITKNTNFKEAKSDIPTDSQACMDAIHNGTTYNNNEWTFLLVRKLFFKANDANTRTINVVKHAMHSWNDQADQLANLGNRMTNQAEFR